jgi:hypothetical protein
MSLDINNRVNVICHIVLFWDEHVNECTCVLDIQPKQMNIQITSVQCGCCSSHRRRYSYSKYRIKKGMMMPRADTHKT